MLECIVSTFVVMDQSELQMNERFGQNLMVAVIDVRKFASNPHNYFNNIDSSID